MLLVCIRRHLNSVLRHEFLIFNTCHSDVLYVREQEEDPWLIFEAKVVRRKKKVWGTLLQAILPGDVFTQFLTYSLFYTESVSVKHNCRSQLAHISVCGRQKLHHFLFQIVPMNCHLFVLGDWLRSSFGACPHIQ